MCTQQPPQTQTNSGRISRYSFHGLRCQTRLVVKYLCVICCCVPHQASLERNGQMPSGFWHDRHACLLMFCVHTRDDRWTDGHKIHLGDWSSFRPCVCVHACFWYHILQWLRIGSCKHFITANCIPLASSCANFPFYVYREAIGGWVFLTSSDYPDTAMMLLDHNWESLAYVGYVWDLLVYGLLYGSRLGLSYWCITAKWANLLSGWPGQVHGGPVFY